MAVNKVILLGHLGKDPEIRAMTNGNEVATFSLATSEVWKDKTTGEKKEKTEWHKIVVYSAGIVNIIKKYLHKGDKVYIEGALQTRKWTDKDGLDKYTTEIVLQGFNATLQLLGGGNKEKDEDVKDEDFVEDVKEEFEGAKVLDDDIPF